MTFNKGKKIKNILGELLVNYGYEYKGKNYDGWSFEKKEGHLIRGILIFSYRHSKDLISVELYTNLPGIPRYTAKKFASSMDGDLPNYWNCGTSEEDFEKALLKIKDELKKSGIPILEVITEDQIEVIYEDLEKALCENYAELSEDFKKRFSIVDTSFNEKNIENWFEKIESKKVLFEDSEEGLQLCLQFAAFITDILCAEMDAHTILKAREYDGKKYCKIICNKSAICGAHSLNSIIMFRNEMHVNKNFLKAILEEKNRLSSN